MERYKRRFFDEAVINVDKYSKLLQDIFYKKIKHDVKNKEFNRIVLQWYFNKIFTPFCITFKIIKDEQIKKGYEYRYGLIQAETLMDKCSTIILFCNLNILDFNKSDTIFEEFSRIFIKAISHELIHRIQVIEISDLKIKRALANNKKEDFEYYSTKQELMAYAWEILEELRFSGLTDNEIEKKFKTLNFTVMHSNILNKYLKLYDNHPKVLQQLYKYIYMYIEGQFSDKVI
jgi:hypothetical protein